MELLAHVWGSDEAKEGMNAFLEGRKPDFQRFRMRDKQELEHYMEGFYNDENSPPSMRGGKAQQTLRVQPVKSAKSRAPAKAAKGSRQKTRS
jgi:hypothetical protein